MTLLEVFMGPSESQEERSQKEKLRRARKDRADAKGTLLRVLKECQEDSTKLATKLAQAVRKAEDLDDSSTEIPKPEEDGGE